MKTRFALSLTVLLAVLTAAPAFSLACGPGLFAEPGGMSRLDATRLDIVVNPIDGIKPVEPSDRTICNCDKDSECADMDCGGRPAKCYTYLLDCSKYDKVGSCRC